MPALKPGLSNSLPEPLQLRCVLSTADGQRRLAEQAPLLLQGPAGANSAHSDLPSVMVHSGRRFQTLLGFGGAFTEAAAVTWSALPEPERAALLRQYFDADSGHGYTLCRLHMNSCDFALGNYAHAAVAGDVLLEHFNIERDRKALLPMIKAAQALAQQAGSASIRLLASPWSPAPWMKSNGQMNQGGELLPEYAAVWAQCYVRFIQAYAAEGVPIWGLTVQNEPAATQRWDSCIYSAEQERDFVRDHLGPALAAAGLGHIKIIVWDHNRDLMVERAAAVYSDPEAAQYVWGCGFHWYGEDHFEHVQLLHDAWPDKALLFTEGCQEGGPHLGSAALGERYARNIIKDLNRWTVGWIDWNLLLDETGGPNHVGNLCSAPIMANRQTGELMPQSSYDYLGHFARFIKPGAQRLLCAASKQDLEVTAFINPDGSKVLVALNRSEADIHYTLKLDARQCQALAQARSISSFVLAA
ncbi:glucosylceramidase [Paucibacter sp. TC2R-5]|uniref:glycoside hydrolase family 30 protein n=1 Tax=Paucibacter sp. TC2R-5 TaxID=2893555 RepID=UPI0021E3B0F2|nr:glycoside hydrolase family 30 protein [Paucibacter sp. TC2R-5]MCV2360763.1 glucosylceramidase [Paucibacter sp. TC2R-5]